MNGCAVVVAGVVVVGYGAPSRRSSASALSGPHGASAPFLGNRHGARFTSTLRATPDLRENALADHDAPRREGGV
ncbi:hypothetical protein [Streptomyces sp. NPDC054838]